MFDQRGGNSSSDNVFVRSLPAGLSEEQVTQIFAQYGRVTSTKVVSKPGQSWTAALIRFASDAEAAFVVQGLNGNIPQGLSTPVEARYANSPGQQQQQQHHPQQQQHQFNSYPQQQQMQGMKGQGKGKGKTDIPMDHIIRSLVDSGGLPGGNGQNKEHIVEVFCFGLPPDCTDIHLYKMFSPFGPISPKGLKVMTSKEDGSCIGYGFINFMSIEAAQLAIATLNGAILPNMRRLKVELKGSKKAGESAAPKTPEPKA